MPTIIDTIREYEEDILYMIAEAWGIDMEHASGKKLAELIASHLGQTEVMDEMFHTLAQKQLRALIAVARLNGTIPWDQFIRKNGEFREMGASRRDRERPDRNPISITEALFYKALIGRAFLETDDGLREFAFLPSEFHKYLSATAKQADSEVLRTISTQRVLKTLLTNDHIVDHASTILAGLRIGLNAENLAAFIPNIPIKFLTDLLIERKIITTKKELSADLAKSFLESPRSNALVQLALAWKENTRIDELDLIEKLVFEGQRKNNPHTARNHLLKQLQILDKNAWYGIDEFCNWIKNHQPDFLRSGGEYESWFIKKSDTEEFINGFENWQLVEGEYLRMMITMPLFWLGFVDLGKQAGDTLPSCFRKSKWFELLIRGNDFSYPSIHTSFFEIEKNGKIIVERYFPRDIRYQIARCSDWEQVHGNRYIYQLTPKALRLMEKQGLTINQLITLINRYARKPIPINILSALENWKKHKQEALIEQIIVVRLESSEIVDQLMKSPVKKYIKSRLNPATIEIAANSAPQLKVALIEMGIFSKIKPEV